MRDAHLQTFRLRNFHHAAANLLLRRLDEGHLQAVVLQRLDLLGIGVVADADNGDFGYLMRQNGLRHKLGQASTVLQPTLMVLMRSAMPPRSPADIPSTSSMMSTWRLGVPSKFTAVLVTISFTTFDNLPAMPPFTSESACRHMLDVKADQVAPTTTIQMHAPCRGRRWHSPPSHRSPRLRT